MANITLLYYIPDINNLLMVVVFHRVIIPGELIAKGKSAPNRFTLNFYAGN